MGNCLLSGYPGFYIASKLGLSFVAMGILVLVGTLIFNLELAIPSILKFSTVFVAYYLIASFRANKHCAINALL
jgi:hypothetical protein